MILSEAFRLRNGAALYVMRNNGDCWGRIVTADGEERDVYGRSDQYNAPDHEAAEYFERQFRRGKSEPAVGWFLSEEHST
jgi:hypothetical protein